MTNTMLVTGTIITVLGAMFFYFRSKVKNLPLVSDNEDILILTDKNFQHQTRNKIVLIDFWAGWCAPCRMMAPVLNEVSGELSGNAFVGKVNIEEYQSLAQKFQIRNIPTMVLLKNGVEVNRFVGIKTRKFLVQQINEIR
jgi:thioredoxin 1